MWKGAVEWRGSGTIGTNAEIARCEQATTLRVCHNKRLLGHRRSLKDRAYYDSRSAPHRRHLIAATESLIAASRELITHARPPELWPLYEDDVSAAAQ
jgi:hypothetical protein